MPTAKKKSTLIEGLCLFGVFLLFIALYGILTIGELHQLSTLWQVSIDLSFLLQFFLSTFPYLFFSALGVGVVSLIWIPVKRRFAVPRAVYLVIAGLAGAFGCWLVSLFSGFVTVSNVLPEFLLYPSISHLRFIIVGIATAAFSPRALIGSCFFSIFVLLFFWGIARVVDAVRKENSPNLPADESSK